MAFEITRRRVERPAHLADAPRYQFDVEDRPDAHRQIRFAALEVEQLTSADGLQRDVGVLTPEPRKVVRKECDKA